MSCDLYVLHGKRKRKPHAQYMIAGWKPQWSDGGEISSGLPQYLVKKLNAKLIGELGEQVSTMCYPFQVPGTHDVFRPAAVFQDGVPTKRIFRENYFYDAGNGLIIFLGEEPWFRIDIYAEAFFHLIRDLGIKQAAGVEGYNGPAPPDLERSVNCSYSGLHMRDELEKHAVSFSNYGSDRRAGPTIAMALIAIARFDHPDIELLRLGAMAPMYSFLTSKNEPVGISRDHRAFYDIMRRLKSLYKIEIDLGELKERGDSESERLVETLDRVAASSSTAKEIIDRARADFKHTPYVEPVELAPALDRELDSILRNMPEEPEEEPK